MGRIMAIDFGLKRCGIAVTDEECLVAGPLDTIPPENAENFIKEYCESNTVGIIVIGLPKRLNQEDTHVTQAAISFKLKLDKVFEDIEFEMFDERFTSKIAFESLKKTGAHKKLRKNKKLLDETSAVVLLQSYMQAKGI